MVSQESGYTLVYSSLLVLILLTQTQPLAFLYSGSVHQVYNKVYSSVERRSCIYNIGTTGGPEEPCGVTETDRTESENNVKIVK